MKNKRESGEVVVEASIIVTLVMIFITIMLYIGMILYQQTLVSVMANQTAANIAQVYGNNLKDPFTGYVDPDRVYQSITYSNMKTDAYMTVIEQKADVFARYRLKSSRILANGSTSVDIDIVKKPNELLKSQVVVTVRDSYDVPLVGIFGTNSLVKFASQGRADCVDLLEYLNGVEAVSDPESSPIPSIPDSDTCLVTFITDKYSGGFHATVPVLRGKSIISSNHFSHSTMPIDPRLNGMKFKGWVTADGHNFSASTQVDENLTVYGSWECTVTFDADGGSVNPVSKAVAYMMTVEFPTPGRSGYSFQGWYTEKNGAGEPYYSNVTQITKNITLYAKWQCTHVGAMVKAATPISKGNCKTKSVWKYTCSRCGYIEERQGAFGDHIKSNTWTISTEATCTKEGREVKYCTVAGCGSVRETREIAALGHNMGAWQVTKAASCGVKGEETRYCSRCEYKETREIAALSHNWGDWKIEKKATSSSVENGTMVRICKTSGCRDAKAYKLCTKHKWGHCGKKHTYYNRYGNKKNVIFEGDSHPYSTHYTPYFYCVVCVNCLEYSGGKSPDSWGDNIGNGNKDFARYKWCGECYPKVKDITDDDIKNTHLHD